MRKLFCFLCMIILTFPLLAQQNRGNIVGKIVDQDGNSLPQVRVTLTGPMSAPLATVTSAEGIFRFLSLDPVRGYVIKAELEGFKPLTRGNLDVVVGRNTEITLAMEMGTIEEEITVIAASPVVESKKTQVATNVTQDQLQSLPTARDPWVVLQQTPGVLVDRENIGGSESGQQAGFIAKGGGFAQWAMDGVVITDPAAIASPSYFDFDAFEEMNITTGGMDVSIQGGGLSLNMVTRRGGNRVSLGGRFYLVDSKLQAAHTGDKIKEIQKLLIAAYPDAPGFNQIRNIKDFGFNMGGPLWKDKIWWWMSYGVQDIKTNVVMGTADDTLLQNYAGKINLQLLPQNRAELFTHVGNKEKFGRSSSYSFPGGWHQTGKYHFGSPLYKIQDEHMFGDNLFVTLKWAFNDAGFNLIPMWDEELQKMGKYDQFTSIWGNTYSYYHASRPSHSLYFQANYFNDDLLGLSHEFKVGADWRKSNGAHTSTWPGNAVLYYNYDKRGILTVDVTGDNVRDVVSGISYFSVWRGWQDNNWITGYAGYFSDTITVGRLNVILGFRYDVQIPRIEAYTMQAVQKDNKAWTDNASAGTINAIDKVLPGLNVPDVDPNWNYSSFSPRVGLTYDVFGDGKTIAKATFNRYGEFMGTGWASYWSPTGTGGSMGFWWLDGNKNGIIDVTELFWNYPGAYAPVQVFDSAGNIIADAQRAYLWMWSGYDINTPQKVGAARYTVDDSYSLYYINEFIATLEREILPDFGAALDFTYRKFTNYAWALQWDGSNKASMQSQDWYGQHGTVPSSVGGFSTKEAAGKPLYYWKAGYKSLYPLYLTENPDYYQDFMGVELRLNKRLSNRWMLNASATLQTEKAHYGDKGYLDPTNIWALDDRIYAPGMGGGSGKINMRVFSTWIVKATGLYQFPYDFNVSFAFNARQGHIPVEGASIVDYSAPNPYNQSVGIYFQKFGELRLPNFWNLDLRIEKVIRAGDIGRIYVMADVFNLFNQQTENRRYDAWHGTYYVHNQAFVKSATDNMLNEVLNPRVVRLGVRFQY